MNRLLLVLAGLVGAAAVGLGAYGAHGLAIKLAADGLLPEEVAKKLNTCDIAVRYHLVHAVSLLVLAIAPATWAPKQRLVAALFFVLGLAMFCGILYAQAILGLKGYNLVVPLGGLSFIIGWLCIAALGLRKSPVAL